MPLSRASPVVSRGWLHFNASGERAWRQAPGKQAMGDDGNRASSRPCRVGGRAPQRSSRQSGGFALSASGAGRASRAQRVGEIAALRGVRRPAKAAADGSLTTAAMRIAFRAAGVVSPDCVDGRSVGVRAAGRSACRRIVPTSACTGASRQRSRGSAARPTDTAGQRCVPPAEPRRRSGSLRRIDRWRPGARWGCVARLRSNRSARGCCDRPQARTVCDRPAALVRMRSHRCVPNERLRVRT